MPPSSIAGGNVTDRPIGTSQQSPWPKTFKCNLEVWPKIVRRPVFPVCLRSHSAQLAVNIGALPEFSQVFAPRRKFPITNLRFPQMVKHKDLDRMAVN